MQFSLRWRRGNTRCFILGISSFLPGTSGDMKRSEVEVIVNVLVWEWLNPTDLPKAWVEKAYFTYYRVIDDEKVARYTGKGEIYEMNSWWLLVNTDKPQSPTKQDLFDRRLWKSSFKIHAPYHNFVAQLLYFYQSSRARNPYYRFHSKLFFASILLSDVTRVLYELSKPKSLATRRSDILYWYNMTYPTTTSI